MISWFGLPVTVRFFGYQYWLSLPHSNSSPKELNPDYPSDFVTVQSPFQWHSQEGCDIWDGCKGNREVRCGILPLMLTSHDVQTSFLISGLETVNHLPLILLSKMKLLKGSSWMQSPSQLGHI